MMFNNRNVSISTKAHIGTNVKIGDNCIIFDNVTIDDNSIISHNCVIGEPSFDFFQNPDYVQPETYIGSDSIIRSHTIIYAGSKTGDHFVAAHRVLIRENCIIGNHCMIGLNSEVQADVIIEDYTRIYSNVSLAQGTKIGKYVFLYPGVITTNDPLPPSNELNAPEISDYTVVCTAATILPKVRIGKYCLVGSNSLVSGSFTDKSMIIGNPAKYLMNVEDFKVLGNTRPYPWMERFSRGMPWNGSSYNEWSR